MEENIGLLQRRPICRCCAEHISQEFCLVLQPFGSTGVACEACVQKYMGYTQDLED